MQSIRTGASRQSLTLQDRGLTRASRLTGLAPTLRQARPLTLARTIATSSPRPAAPVPASTTQQRAPAVVNPSITPAQANDAFALAKAGSNQLSLETPRNGVEYALGTMDKIVNWARQGFHVAHGASLLGWLSDSRHISSSSVGGPH